MTVEIHHDVSAIADWDELAAASGAPVFFNAAFLSAYRKTDMAPADAHAYLALRDEDGSLRAALPAVLLPRMDPAGSLTVYEPALAARPAGLLSPNWHCYDAWLPTRDADDLPAVAAVLGAFQELAGQFAAPWYGLVNVDATGPLAAALNRLGAHGLPIDERYVLDLPPGFGLSDYADRLSGRDRFAMRSHRRRAARAGTTVRVVGPEEADLDTHLALVRASGAEHRAGEAEFASSAGLPEFLLRLGGAVRIIEVCVGGRVAGVGICLLDARRLHFWACGVDQAAAGGEFNPLFVLFHEVLRHAIGLGASSLECGRHHGEFKRRYGLRPVPLLAYVSPTGRPLVRAEGA